MRSKLDNKIKLNKNSRRVVELGYQFTVSTYKDLFGYVEDIIKLYDWYLNGVKKSGVPVVIAV